MRPQFIKEDSETKKRPVLRIYEKTGNGAIKSVFFQFDNKDQYNNIPGKIKEGFT